MFNSIKNADIRGKTVFLRADLNISIKDGKIIDDTRIKATIPTIQYLVDGGAKVVLASHLGSPGGKVDPGLSLKIVLERLRILMPRVEFHFASDCLGDLAKKAVAEAKFGEVVLLENLRFHPGEEANDPEYAKELAGLADIYVDDAFSTAHRKHASMVGIPELLPAYAGLNMEDEITNLSRLVSEPERPAIVIAGGSKVSTKLSLLQALVKKFDYVFVGGAMANTFLYALGKGVGKSLYEADLKDEALKILADAKTAKCEFLLPVDCVCAKEIADGVSSKVCDIDDVGEDDMILDIGPKTIGLLEEKLEECETAIWNGPIGVYEVKPFDAGTDKLASIIAEMTEEDSLKSVAGGGDILAALNRSGHTNSFTYVSTAGGAFLKWLENGKLPAVEKLKK